MCDMRTFRRIENAIETKMAAGQMFTAFDITLAVQKGRIKKLHCELRRDIRRVADHLMGDEWFWVKQISRPVPGSERNSPPQQRRGGAKRRGGVGQEILSN